MAARDRKNISLSIPPELWARVEASADARYQTITAWVVDAILTKLRTQ